MMKKYRFLGMIVTIVIIVIFTSCNKPPVEFPNSSEAISFKNLDTLTIEKKAGEELEVDVVLITDTIIDSLLIGYFIDTIGVTSNITFREVKTIAVSTNFPEVNNKHEFKAIIKLPSNAYGVRAFRPYIKGKGDYVRIIFRMVAGSRAYEKQLKVIIQP